MHLNFMMKSSFFNPVSFIEREATFENNSDMEVKLRHKKSPRAFLKETQ